jgi:N-acetylglucosamine kinase-like BadF-type ATPase
MELIADSGSTTTTWCLTDDHGQHMEYQTVGMNPYFMTEEDICSVIKDELIPSLKGGIVKTVHFYGAGCSVPNKSEVVRTALQKAFIGSAIYVEHDLMGAARALLHKEEGLAAILGTGSNSCHFDGEKIIQNIPSLGYLLGDEGSGAYLGKMLVRAYLAGKLTNDLQLELSSFCKLSKEEILDAIYRKPFPNRFLASFSPFLRKRIGNPTIKSIVDKGFSDFFEAHILKYPGHNSLMVGFVGSVSYYFKGILKDVAKKNNVQLGKILKSPIQGLVSYHT